MIQPLRWEARTHRTATARQFSSARFASRALSRTATVTPTESLTLRAIRISRCRGLRANKSARSLTCPVMTEPRRETETGVTLDGPAGPGPLRNATVRGAAYLASREGLGALIRLAGVTLVVRLVGPTNYGIYAGAAIFVTLAAMVAQGGIEVFLIRQPAEPSEEVYQVAYTFLLISSFAIGLTAFCLSFAVGIFVHSEQALDVFRVLLISIPVNVIWAPAQARIERRLDYKTMGIIEIVGDVVLYAVSVPLALIHLGAWALVAGFCAWQTWLLLSSLILSGLRPRLRWSPSVAKSLLRHSTTYGASRWIDSIGALSLPIVVGISRGATGLGYVAFALRLTDTIAFAQRGTWRLGLASISRVGDQPERLRRGIEEGSLLQLLALGIPLAIVTSNARWIIPTIFGAKWAPAIGVFALLSLVAFLRGPALMQSTVLYSRGLNKPNVIAAIIRQSCTTVAVILLVPNFGIIGFGLASACSLVSLAYLQSIVRRQVVSFSYRRLRPFAIGLAPAMLIPFAPMPWALLMICPLCIILICPGPRASMYDTYVMLRLALVSQVGGE